ncbi:MAG: hypothetical protein ACJ735_08245 [Actinomycetes bacterium]
MTIAMARTALRFESRRYCMVKDPCPVFDGSLWHLFGTGITSPHVFELLHATAPSLRGPWQVAQPIRVDIPGGCVAAPGVVASRGRLHMFLQTEYNKLGGTIEHLVSIDCGTTFHHVDTALTSQPGTEDAGIYDPHPAEIGGWPYLVYSGFRTVGEPDVHLARSVTGRWSGPWERLGPILRHEHVDCHNQRGEPLYEWGLEGGQLIELPDGDVLLNAVCFLRDAPAGCRQRVFFARASTPLGPYAVDGPVLSPVGGDHAGENGHGTLVLDGKELALFFQERDANSETWRYALAAADVDSIPSLGEAAPTDDIAGEEAA